MDSFLFASDDVVIESTRCSASEARFGEPQTQVTHAFVFPRTITKIDDGEGRSVTANPTAVMMLNQNQRYTRRPVSDLDASVRYVVSDTVLLQLLAPFDKKLSLYRPFRFLEAAPPAATLIRERVLHEMLASGTFADRVEIEESVFQILGAVVRAAYGHKRGRLATRREIDGVEAVREWIARNPEANPSLPELSAIAGLPPMKLCRAFRLRTGLTLTRFRHVLRGCLALDLMTGGSKDLLEISLSLGYSSHSHFTYVFRRIFGEAPSAIRRRLTAPSEAATAAARSAAHASR
jgi:AraC-like DNA-binding protein